MVSAGLRSDTKMLRNTRANSGSRSSRCNLCSCSGHRVICASCFCTSLARICIGHGEWSVDSCPHSTSSLNPKHSPAPAGPGTPPSGEQVAWPEGWLAVPGWRTQGCWAQLCAGLSHSGPSPSGPGQRGEIRSLSWPSHRGGPSHPI